MKAKAKFQHSVDGVLYKKGDYYRNCSEEQMNESIRLGLAERVTEKPKRKKLEPVKQADDGLRSDISTE